MYRRIAMLVVGAAAAATIALPASTWQAPEDDFTMRGFDSTLMYSDATNGSAVEISDSTASIVTQPGGSALLHLVSSPLSFVSTFDFVVQQNDVGAEPVTISLTSPYLGQEMQLAFQPDGTVSQQRVADGTVVAERLLGDYEFGQPYRITARLNRSAGTAVVSMAPKSGVRGDALSLSSSGTDSESHAVVRRLIPVDAGQDYVFSSKVVPRSAGLAGLSIAWYDKDRNRLDLRSSWSRTGSDASAVRTRALSARAPKGAAFAEPEVAVGASGSAAFADIALTSLRSSDNLVPHDQDGVEASGWRRAKDGTALAVLQFTDSTLTARTNSQETPRLFSSLRMALTVASAGGTAVTRVQASDYDLQVPHQRWLATRVTGTAVHLVVLTIAALALVLLMMEGWSQRVLLRRRMRRLLDSARTPRPGVVLLLLAAIAAYGSLSLVMSGLGSLNADTIGARVWTYVASLHGPGELYFMPNVSSAEAVQWQGKALQEAGFPYGPTMAYVISGIAVLYRFAVHQDALGVPDAVVLDFMIRMANALFGLIAAILVYAIARALRARQRAAAAIAAVFLFAPALTVANVVWATTQSMSMVFLLGAILAILRGPSTLSWLLLLAAMMTRPQNLIAAALIAVWLLAAQPLRSTLRSVATALLIVFVALVPLMLATAPSLPVDVMVNALFLHVGNGNDAWTVPVSWGTPGPWTLVESLFGRESGVHAMLYPAETPLVGRITYYQLGSLAFGSFLLVLIVVAVARRRRLAADGGFILLGMLGVLALLQLKTGAPTYHMMQATVLSFLLFRVLSRPVYYYVATTLSITTAWSMLALGMYWLSQHPLWATGLFRPDTLLARALLWSVQDEWFVAAMCVLNTSVLVILTVRLLVPKRASYALTVPLSGRRRATATRTSALELKGTA